MAVCQGLDDLSKAVTAWTAGFDARTLTPGQASSVAERCARLEAALSSVKALAAARAAEGAGWKAEGYRHPADQLAHRTGMTPTAARRALDTGRRLADQPEVASAARSGQLSADQAAAISDAVAADPGAGRQLIAEAPRLSMRELHEKVARTKAATGDPEARRRDRHARRSLRRWTDLDGALAGRLYGQPEDGVSIWRMLDPIRRRLIMVRRQSGPGGQVEPLDALDYDALLTVARLACGESADIDVAELLHLGLFPGLAPEGEAGEAADPLGAGPGRDAATLSDPPGTPPPAGPGRGAATLFDPPGTPRPAGPVAGGGESGAGPAGRSGPAGIAGAAVGALLSAGSGPPARPEPRRSRGGRPKRLAGSPMRVIIRIDLSVLLRGVPIEGELCEIAGWGPVPVSVIERLMASGQCFVAAALTNAEQVVGVYHQRRKVSAAQRTALEFSQPACSVEGCSATAGLQYDHRLDWAASGITAFDLIDRLCRRHHARKTVDGWAMVPGSGKRAFVPPGDPRHPANSPPGPAPGPPRFA